MDIMFKQFPCVFQPGDWAETETTGANRAGW